MSSFQLKAEKREKLGSLEARRIKKNGKIPAVIYSKSGNVNVIVDKKEFEQEFLKGDIQARVAEISILGKTVKAIAHKVELDPVSDHPIHVEFFNCEESKTFSAKLKVNFINQEKAPGLKKGGFLNVVLRKVELICSDVNNVPEKIDVDVGAMHLGQKIKSEHLPIPENTRLAKNGSFLIASIIGRGKSEEDPAAAAAAGASTAAASTTAAKPAAAKPAAEKKK